MSAPDLSADLARDAAPDNLVEAGLYLTLADGSNHGLVVLAMGRPYWLAPFDGQFRLLVEPDGIVEIRRQLASFDRESRGWPPAVPVDHAAPREIAWITPLLWSVSILVAFEAQQRWPGLTGAGAMDSAAVFDRAEWWRAATALFLHADAAHVISNALSGIPVLAAAISTLGRLRGWVLLAVGSILGNLAAAAIHYPATYRSLGASTAIFCALGLLTGRAMRIASRSSHPHRWRITWVPLAAGLAILGLYGAGGVRVDLLAHLTGLLAGVGLGFVGTAPGPRQPHPGTSSNR